MSTKNAKKDNVKSILSNFKKNAFAIEYYYNKFGNLAQGEDLDGTKRAKEYLVSCLKEAGIDPKASKIEKEKINVSSAKVMELVANLRKIPKISGQNYEILSRSSFLMLNNYFEYLLSDLLSYYYNKFQNSLNEKKFSITLKETNEFETIEELTKTLIKKEVESMMVELTFDELLDHFQKNLKIDNENELINWNAIREYRERRHLIVHNSSAVNKKYLARTKNPFSLNLGDVVHIEQSYFIKSCRDFYIAGLLLSYNCWGNWDKDETTNAIHTIMIDSYELLKQKEYNLVLTLTMYAKKGNNIQFYTEFCN